MKFVRWLPKYKMIGDCDECGHSAIYHIPLGGCIKCGCEEYV
jgi:predicted nucleic-acid-binding Zn-ribbon protein